MKSVKGINEPLLNDGGELTDSLALLSEDVLGSGSLDDDLSAGGGDSHLQTCVSILRQLLGEQLRTKKAEYLLCYSFGRILKERYSYLPRLAQSRTLRPLRTSSSLRYREQPLLM